MNLTHSILLSACLVAFGPSLVHADLTAQIWDNVVFAPANSTSSKIVTVPSVSVSTEPLYPFPSSYCSIRFTGTLIPIVSDSALNFSIVSEGGVRLWVDDFLIVDAGAVHNATPTSRTSIQTISVLGGIPLAFRLEYSFWNDTASSIVPTLSLYWQGTNTPYEIVPSNVFQSNTSNAQMEMAALRDRLIAPPSSPWQTYYRRSMTGHTLAPTGVVIVASVVDAYTNQVLNNIFIQRGGSSSYISRAGLHSRNGSDYTHLAAWNWNSLDCNISMETTVVMMDASVAGSFADDSSASASPQLQFLASAYGNDCFRLRLLINPVMFDERVGVFSNSSNGFVVSPPGFQPVYVAPAVSSVPVNSTIIPNDIPYFALSFASQGENDDVHERTGKVAPNGDVVVVVGYCAQAITIPPHASSSSSSSPLDAISSSFACPPLSEMIANVESSRVVAAAESSAWAQTNLSSVGDGIAAAVLWNTVFTVHEGVISIVSRNPNWAGNSEFVADYVLFCWDSYFIALQAVVLASNSGNSTSSLLLDIGVSTLVQITLSRTPRGFVPNWKSGAHSSYDRTENQVGAVISLVIANLLPNTTTTTTTTTTSKESIAVRGTGGEAREQNIPHKAVSSSWVIELLFPPLLSWHNWVWNSRTAVGGVLNGQALMILGSDPSSPHDNGDGTLQGARYESMDNSPAYDSPPIAFNQTTHQMELYDVSPTALFLSDTEALMTLAGYIGREDVLPILQQHFTASAMALNSYLWNEELGAYANKLFNGTWNARLNPSTFYPFLSGVVTDAQAEDLAELLVGADGFCVNASHTPGILVDTRLMTRWSSRVTRHTIECVSAECTSDVLLYEKGSFQGVEASVPVSSDSGGSSGRRTEQGVPLPPPFPNAIALNIYVSESLGNVTALATEPPDSSFVLSSLEGWCFPIDTIAPPSGGFFQESWPLTNLTLWKLVGGGSGASWLFGEEGEKVAASVDFRTCGTLTCETSSQQAGYTLVSSMCKAFDASNVSTTLPCTVPVPSIARGDANFADQNYWRGRAWAPQVMLVYLGLRRYEHIPVLSTARQDLISLGKKIMLAEWEEYGNVVENLSGITGISQDSGNADPFYAWGGCFALPGMLEVVMR